MPKGESKYLSELQAYHLQKFTEEELEPIKQARRFYNGDFWEDGWDRWTPVKAGEEDDNSDSPSRFRTAKNMIFSIVEAATYNLTGSNPRVAVKGDNPMSVAVAPMFNGRLDKVFRDNDIRDVSTLAIVDACLAGRGIFKTTWSASRQMPHISVRDPANVFFDDRIRLKKDISYWLESTAVPAKVFRARVEGVDGKEPIYTLPAGASISPSSYPRHMQDADPAVYQSRGPRKFVNVWEFYDVVDQKCIHYVDGGDNKAVVLKEEDLRYPSPLSLFYLNHNAKDCRGLSEVKLVLELQRTLVDLLTLVVHVAHLQLPKIGYDDQEVDGKKLSQAAQAAVGSYVPTGRTGGTGQGIPKPLSELFYDFPMPKHPDSVVAVYQLLEEVVTYVSALAESSRGQITNARTATEVAVLDAQMQTRLSTRRANLYSALEEVAEKCFMLDRMYLPAEVWVRTAGSKATDPLARLIRDDLISSEFSFDTVAYNPIRENPAIVLESLAGLVPFIKQSEAIDQLKFDQFLVRGAGAPEEVMLSEAEILDRINAQAEAAQATTEQGQGQEALPPGVIPIDQGLKLQQQGSDIAATRNAPIGEPVPSKDQPNTMEAEQ